ncbi:DTX3L ligase, partial [Donacobius atricapilla]|nr:DTX3L ligase [Donacobius atricapilla]
RGTALQSLFKMSYSSSKVGDPRPGQPYKGGNFYAFLPDNKEGQKTAELLKRAFERGLTFQIKSCNREERVTWGFIPHKTSWGGGKARNGYPDAQYLHEVSTLL